MRRAGCHVYLDSDDVVFAAGKFLAIHAASEGVKSICLPARSDVFEVFSRKELGRQVESLSLPMSFGQTALLYFGSAPRPAGD